MNSVFLARLEKIFGKDYSSVSESFALERRPSVRVNTLVVGEEEGFSGLERLGFKPQRVIEGENAFVLNGRTKRELTETEEYKNGWYYIQSLSSMVPVWSIADEVRERVTDDWMVLDMCAAPGSKTSQLSAVMEGKGKIIALDTSRQRLYMLKSNMEQQKVSNVYPQLGNGTSIWKKYGPMFDIVLLDAPCSGEGRFSALDQKSYEDWSMKKVERLATEQKRLMFSAVMCLKQDGLLVYSTCTFAPEENEEIVQFALEKFDGALEVVESSVKRKAVSEKNDLTDVLCPGLLEWNGKKINPEVHKAVRIKPNEMWEGFFVCVMRRK